MLDKNRAVYFDNSPLGPGWFACHVVGNRITYIGPLKNEAEARKVSEDEEQKWLHTHTNARDAAH